MFFFSYYCLQTYLYHISSPYYHCYICHEIFVKMSRRFKGKLSSRRELKSHAQTAGVVREGKKNVSVMRIECSNVQLRIDASNLSPKIDCCSSSAFSFSFFFFLVAVFSAWLRAEMTKLDKRGQRTVYFLCHFLSFKSPARSFGFIYRCRCRFHRLLVFQRKGRILSCHFHFPDGGHSKILRKGHD